MPRIRLKNKNYVKQVREIKSPFWLTIKFWLIIILIYVVWIYGLRRPVYQHLYGKPAEPLPEQMVETWEDVAEQDWQETKVGRYKIRYMIRKKYSVVGRIVYLDWYHFIGTWYRSAMYEGHYLYDGVMPVDVSVIHGAMAAEDNWRKYKYTHQYRMLVPYYKYKDNPIYVFGELNNNHTIPASKNILRALKIVKIGEPVYIEGYLIDWEGTGKYADFEITTAATSGEIHKDRYGGELVSIKCRQIFVTKISFGGYTFE